MTDINVPVDPPSNVASERQPARTEEVEIGRIRDDSGAQMRVEMSAQIINDYANDMLDGASYPAIIVFDDGTDLWLADGYHRFKAKQKIGAETILTEIRQGSRRDAVLHGAGANAQHGLRRSPADKRRAIETLLKDAEWAQLSDRKVGEITKTDHETVGAVRRELAGGDFPTDRSKKASGDFPTVNGKPSNRASLIRDLLANIADDVLVAECRRRGLTVGGNDV